MTTPNRPDSYYENLAARVGEVVGIDVPARFIRRAEEITGKDFLEFSTDDLQHVIDVNSRELSAADLEMRRCENDLGISRN